MLVTQVWTLKTLTRAYLIRVCCCSGYAQMASLVVNWMQDLNEVEPAANALQQPLDEAAFLRVTAFLKISSVLNIMYWQPAQFPSCLNGAINQLLPRS